MRTLLVADLHLSSETPEVNQGFYRYLETTAKGADALYVLGDLFDAWIGDDLLDHPTPLTAVANEVILRLKTLSDSGTAVHFMHGNRDFLIGERFVEAAGASLMPEEQALEIGGLALVVLHGDSLCTRDDAYMGFRQQSRSEVWQGHMLALPIEQRLELAKSLRLQSGEANANKAEAIMDVTPEEVVALMQRHGVSTLIHGHTHRPKVHDLVVEEVPAKRYVLGDWGDGYGWDIVIEAVDTGLATPALRQFPLDAPPAA